MAKTKHAHYAHNTHATRYRQMDKRDILLLISLVTSAPATSALLSVAFGFYSPIGTGNLHEWQAAALGILLFTLVPTVVALYYYRKGIVDLELSERRARTPVYIVSLGSQLLAMIVFFILNSKIMFVTAVAYVTLTAAMLAINLKWKISAHAAGIAGPVTALTAVFGSSMLPLYLFLIPIFAHRMHIKAHTFWQLAVGALLAFVVTFAVYSNLYLPAF